MKTMNSLKKTVIILFASFIVACGAETVAALIFLPAFAATWPDVNDDEHFIDLRPVGEDGELESGAITGFESHDSDPNKEGDLTGKFNGLNIEFTVERPNGNIKFTGKMTPISDTEHTITKIELTSSEGVLVLGTE
jgi:hypothetical protein